MSKFRVEIQITLIALIIGAAVVTTGYLAYQNLSKIVYSIHQETKPDNQLFLMKDIANDLTALENNVRLYALTNNKSDLLLYDSLQNKIIQNISNLSDYGVNNLDDKALTDSLLGLSAEKLELWHDVLNLHLSESKSEPAFTELYSKVEQKIDTITTKTEKKGFLRKIFGTEKVIIDTTFVKQPLEQDSIRREIQNLESKIVEEDMRITEHETKLIEKNIVLTEKINQLITTAENNENASLIAKTNEADQLAEDTYERLAIFTFSAVILLLLALFVLFNYLRKLRSYQKALQKAKYEAEYLAKAKEQFASNVSHEVRTPVNAIYGLAEQLLQQNTSDQVKEQISVIAQSANHLRNIINDTLDFSKIQSHKLKIDSIHFSPEKVITDVIHLAQNEANKKGIELKFEVQEMIPDALVGDPVRLRQILINLVGNAIKFTDEGNVTLSVKSISKKYLMHHLEMTITDSGIGIPKKDLNSIFDEFVQIENQSGKKFSGTGLGLSIVKKLVELQKGTIQVNSDQGIGTEIRVTIPYPEGKIQNIEVLKFEPVLIPKSFKKLKILIADDEEFNVFLMKAILKKWGVSFRVVSNGNEVVNAAIQENFDFILMDIRMPGKNGIEATKEILSHKPNTNILAVTATKEEIDKDRCFEAGMKGFLLKPFSEREIFDQIYSLIKTTTNSIETKEKSEKLDFLEAKRIANGDDIFFKEMSQLFLKSTNNGLAEIEKSIAAKNYEVIAETCHKMAAPCKHFMANDLYLLIKELENKSEEKGEWAEISRIKKLLEIEINEVNKIVKETLRI